MNSKNEMKRTVAINLKLSGDPANWLTQWKQRGLVTSYTDACLQGLVILRDRFNEQDLKASKVEQVEGE